MPETTPMTDPAKRSLQVRILTCPPVVDANRPLSLITGSRIDDGPVRELKYRRQFPIANKIAELEKRDVLLRQHHKQPAAVEATVRKLRGHSAGAGRVIEEGIGVIGVVVILRVERSSDSRNLLRAEIRPGVEEAGRLRLEELELDPSRVSERTMRAGIPRTLERAQTVFEMVLEEIAPRLHSGIPAHD